MKKRMIGMVCAALAAAGYGVITNESMVYRARRGETKNQDCENMNKARAS